MRVARKLLLLLVAAALLVGSAAPAQADAAKKKKPTACAAAKAKAKKKPTAARKRAVKKACRKPAKKKQQAPADTTQPSGSDQPATPAPTPTPTPAATPSSSSLQDGVVACANTERAARGIAPLAVDPALTRAAQRHAADMSTRRFFDHVNPDGLAPWDRIKAALEGAAPFFTMGENIAMGYRTAEATCTGWMNSTGHKRNILDEKFTLIGAGWVDGYAVQNFGARR